MVAAAPIGLLGIEVAVPMDTAVAAAAAAAELELLAGDAVAGDKSVVVDIDFDLRYMSVHFRNIVATVAVAVAVAAGAAAVAVDIVVERIPIELALQFVRATNWMDFELEPKLYYQLIYHR